MLKRCTLKTIKVYAFSIFSLEYFYITSKGAKKHLVTKQLRYKVVSN
jgi:hypothetical protein